VSDIMVHELKIPQAGESIQEVQIGQWLKKEGDAIRRDETVVELETDKASMDLPAPAAGVLVKILKRDGEIAAIGEVVALIDDAAAPATQTSVSEAPAAQTSEAPAPSIAAPVVMPAAHRVLSEAGVKAESVQATGPGGRLLKEDVLRHAEKAEQERLSAAPAVASPQVSQPTAEVPPAAGAIAGASPGERYEEAVPMTPIRRRIAERLVEAQHAAALLTTFNEIDMSSVNQLRQQYRDRFQAKYGVKLGFMSFFTKAAIEALKEFPAINAEIRGRDIVYRNYFDIGVAIGGGKGLVVPVLRNAERMSFAEIEQKIAEFAERAKSNKIRPEELAGGTFTITNGGVYGSLLSTPIVNPPQSGVLGLHAIQDRPVAKDGQVVIRPMMYIALTYDHRIVDGREAVTFLRRIKEIMEEPARMLLEI
jgi:2-oxoglutarate dehydrogenase E2 component (dihydrolipoamide succinyltransferase)